MYCHRPRTVTVQGLRSLPRYDGSLTPILLADLTPSHRRLVEAAVDGYTDNHAASRYLGISPQTVKNYWSAIYKITGLHRMAAVVVWAYPQVHARRDHRQKMARVDWLVRHNSRRIHDELEAIRSRRESAALDQNVYG